MVEVLAFGYMSWHYTMSVWSMVNGKIINSPLVRGFEIGKKSILDFG